ncbi:decaprenyl-phosphate phosphoribosyltransferase [Streptomyces klenkii]|uniref:Decaprenyl-phosphate phosphoribosyltransferase n=1 Tax=Streptomyces klenkii TaxID=1420899 RepID=A0A3B0B5R6_9ACTN|nr:decaprenyl-phosphate phosphoribosyltransferase [Streptomyces klenkii]RKN65977.1 decaprenyl-phosphate phosphoribosyltransferase [Streptomyces klenkii]
MSRPPEDHPIEATPGIPVRPPDEPLDGTTGSENLLNLPAIPDQPVEPTPEPLQAQAVDRAPVSRPRLQPAAGLLRAARPRQWVKNALVLAAPVAAGRLGSPVEAGQLGIVFALFTGAAVAVYLLNDVMDIEADRAHPRKRHRPIASGIVRPPVACATSALLATTVMAGAAEFCNAPTTVVIGVYLTLQVAYCTVLKHQLVVDLVLVAAGFLMRAMIGGLAIGIPISRWFLITAGFGALFIVASKRYSESRLTQDQGGATRALLATYTAGYLRFVWQLAAGLTLAGYCLWALDGSTFARPAPAATLPWRQLSIVPFVLSVLRYAVFTDRATAGSPEDVVLGDRPLMVIGLIWAALYGCAVAGV